MKDLKLVIIISINTRPEIIEDPELKLISEGMCSRYEEKEIHTLLISIDSSSAIKNLATDTQSKNLATRHTKTNCGRILKKIFDIINAYPYLRLSQHDLLKQNNAALITIAHGRPLQGVTPFFLACVLNTVRESVTRHHHMHLSDFMILQCFFACLSKKSDSHSEHSYFTDLVSRLPEELRFPNGPRLSAWETGITVSENNPARRKISLSPERNFEKQVRLGKMVYLDPKMGIQPITDTDFSDSDTDDEQEPSLRRIPLVPTKLHVRIKTKTIGGQSQFYKIIDPTPPTSYPRPPRHIMLSAVSPSVFNTIDDEDL